jgi:hypothetical protein
LLLDGNIAKNTTQKNGYKNNMFKITEVKSWAKTWGYSIIKEKDDSINGASYYWCKNDDHTVTGVALSVSKVATAIFNHITDNKFVDHQITYAEKQEDAKFSTAE